MSNKANENDVSVFVSIEIGDITGERVKRYLSFFVPLDVLGTLGIGDIVQAAKDSAGDEWVEIIEEREKFEKVMSVSPSNPSGSPVVERVPVVPVLSDAEMKELAKKIRRTL